MKNNKKNPKYLKLDKKFNNFILECDYINTDIAKFKNEKIDAKKYLLNLKNCETIPIRKDNLNLKFNDLSITYVAGSDKNKIKKSEKLLTDKNDEFEINNNVRFLKYNGKLDFICEYNETQKRDVIEEEWSTIDGVDDAKFIKKTEYTVSLENCESRKGKNKITPGKSNYIIKKVKVKYSPKKDELDIEDNLNKEDTIGIIEARIDTLENNLLPKEKSKTIKEQIKEKLKFRKKQLNFQKRKKKIKI